MPSRFIALGCLAILGLILAGCGSEDPERFHIGRGSFPTTAIDAESGTTYWAWFVENDGRPAVFVSRLEADADQPAPPVNVSGDKTSVNPHDQAPAQVLVGPRGTVYVIWSTRQEIAGRRFPASDLVMVRSSDGGRTFSTPVYVNDDHDGPPAGHTFHDATVGPDGTVYVSWIDSRGISAATVEHAGHRASDSDIRLARSNDGGQTFEPSVVVATGTCPCCRSAVRVDAEGKVVVAWRQVFDDNIRDIAVAHSSDGGRTFSAPVRAHADGWEINGCPHSGPSIGAGDAGTLHVAWYTGADGQEGLYHAVSVDGGEHFGDPRRIQPDIPVATARMAVASDDVWLAWEHSLENTIHLAAADGTSPTESFLGRSPALDAVPGRLSLVWTADDAVEAYVVR